jgi:hypothetical protein
MNYLTKEQIFGMYLGQRIVNREKRIEKLIGITMDGMYAITYHEVTMEQSKYYIGIDMDNCKLILRSVKDLTENEMNKLNNIAEKFNDYSCIFEEYSFENYPLFIDGDTEVYLSFLPEQIQYLISIGIDVFNLKEKGFAVYESDLKGD